MFTEETNVHEACCETRDSVPKRGGLELKGIHTEEVVPGAVDRGGWRTLVGGVGPEGVDELDVLEGNGAEGGGDGGCWFIFSGYFNSGVIERGREGGGVRRRSRDGSGTYKGR